MPEEYRSKIQAQCSWMRKSRLSRQGVHRRVCRVHVHDAGYELKTVRDGSFWFASALFGHRVHGERQGHVRLDVPFGRQA